MMIIPVYYYDPLHLTGLSNPVFLPSNLTPTLNSSLLHRPEKLCRLWLGNILLCTYTYNKKFQCDKNISQYSALPGCLTWLICIILENVGRCSLGDPSQYAGLGPMADQDQITWTILIIFSMQHIMESSHTSTNRRASAATWWGFGPIAAKYFVFTSFLLQLHPWARYSLGVILAHKNLNLPSIVLCCCCAFF